MPGGVTGNAREGLPRSINRHNLEVGIPCAVLLAPAGGRSSDPTAVRRHAAADLGAAGARRIAGNCRPRTFSSRNGERGRGVGKMPWNLELQFRRGVSDGAWELEDVRRRNLAVRSGRRCIKELIWAAKTEISVNDYFKLPAGRTWGSTSAVDVDTDGTSIWVYPGFPTIFRGLSGFFVGDLRKRPCGSSWKTRSVFQGAVGALCASTAPSASTGPVRVRQNGSRGGNGELDRRRPRTAVDP